jgi:hypothetical protein
MQDSSSGRTLPRAARGSVGLALAALAFSASWAAAKASGTSWPSPSLLISRFSSAEVGRGAGSGGGPSAPYNVTHRFVGPVVLATISLGLGAPWLAGAFAWAAHIALDWSLGFGLRAPGGVGW